MVEYIRWLKRVTSEEMYKTIIQRLDKSIRIRIRNNKTTNEEQFVILCKRIHTEILKGESSMVVQAVDKKSGRVMYQGPYNLENNKRLIEMFKDTCDYIVFGGEIVEEKQIN